MYGPVSGQGFEFGFDVDWISPVYVIVQTECQYLKHEARAPGWTDPMSTISTFLSTCC